MKGRRLAVGAGPWGTHGASPLRRGTIAAATSLALTALAGVPAQGQPSASGHAPMAAVIEHSAVLSLPASKHPSRLELSALAWDPATQELVAASDRGVLHHYRLRLQDGRLLADHLSSRRVIDPRTNASPNLEALAWRAQPPSGDAAREGHTGPPGGELLLAGEHGEAVLRLSPDGHPRGHLPWPAAVAQALAVRVDAGSKHGVEAIAWHPRHGLLAALQKPIESPRSAGTPGSDDSLAHWIHAASGVRWGFAVAGPRSQLKAIEARPDGSLLLLERVRAGKGAGLRTVLRWLDPTGCGGARLCEAPAVEVRPSAIVGDENHEGLACTDDGTCWLVNDGGPDAAQPTRLIQFRLAPP